MTSDPFTEVELWRLTAVIEVILSTHLVSSRLERSVESFGAEGLARAVLWRSKYRRILTLSKYEDHKVCLIVDSTPERLELRTPFAGQNGHTIPAVRRAVEIADIENVTLEKSKATMSF